MCFGFMHTCVCVCMCLSRIQAKINILAMGVGVGVCLGSCSVSVYIFMRLSKMWAYRQVKPNNNIGFSVRMLLLIMDTNASAVSKKCVTMSTEYVNNT